MGRFTLFVRVTGALGIEGPQSFIQHQALRVVLENVARHLFVACGLDDGQESAASPLGRRCRSGGTRQVAKARASAGRARPPVRGPLAPTRFALRDLRSDVARTGRRWRTGRHAAEPGRPLGRHRGLRDHAHRRPPIGHRVPQHHRVHDVVTRDGLPISSAPRIFRDLAAILGLADLVALGDAMIARKAPLTTAEELARVASVPRFRGRLKAVAAIPLLSDRSEAPPESLLRFAVTLSDQPPVAPGVEPDADEPTHH